ncbi:hypothetical protein TNCV_3753701 [Trichonephila clavipes]|nr:hypothetical protein TNCV_3753701 [Trichonephila clavipes]
MYLQCMIVGSSGQGCTAARRQGSGRLRDTTEREDHHIRRMAVAHHTAWAAEIRVSIGTTVIQRTVRNLLL